MIASDLPLLTGHGSDAAELDGVHFGDVGSLPVMLDELYLNDYATTARYSALDLPYALGGSKYLTHASTLCVTQQQLAAVRGLNARLPQAAAPLGARPVPCHASSWHAQGRCRRCSVACFRTAVGCGTAP